ncbi:hypothetical protein [Actinokineospora iranica]|uniref:Uncharacterized protein n=1 Tax=Actinokineospora iranica TaxID=1271860 RepID=A0A1G6Q4F4_9PSEU|nr:hypothetical protein [Actinokineospora iranica]SDC87352.1 hypothetical protein SAMN05216174_10591 [Actinokineospora iranica]
MPDQFVDLNPTVTDEQRRRAARVVAAASVDARECAELLAMLGLTDAAAEERHAA